MSRRTSTWRSFGISLFIAAVVIRTGPVLAYLAGTDDLLTRLAKFDSDHDGVITQDELTDRRLRALFNRYDINRDGKLTRDEIISGMEREQPGSSVSGTTTESDAALSGGNRGRISKPTGLGGGGTLAPGGGDSYAANSSEPGGATSGTSGAEQTPNLPTASTAFPAGLVRVGQVVPDDLRTKLDLSDKQIKQLEELERSMEARLKSILNARQFDLLQKRLADNMSGESSKGKHE